MVHAETFATVVGLIGLMVSGYVYWLKRRADAALENARRDLRTAETALGQTQVELEEVKNEGTRFQQLMMFLQMQLQVNQSFSEALQQKEKTDERNYQVLKGLFDRHAQELNTNTSTSRDRVLDRVGNAEGNITAKIDGLTQVVKAGLDELLVRENVRDGQLAELIKAMSGMGGKDDATPVGGETAAVSPGAADGGGESSKGESSLQDGAPVRDDG